MTTAHYLPNITELFEGMYQYQQLCILTSMKIKVTVTLSRKIYYNARSQLLKTE